MDTTTILVALIIGFAAITVFSLMALVFVRRRERERDNKDAERKAKTIEELDAALDTALAEINKIGALIQKEIDEKYKSVLFLYDLVEDKQKEISEATNEKAISAMVAKHIETHSAKLRLVAHTAAPKIKEDATKASALEEDKAEVKKEIKKPPKFSNPKQKQIWEMREKGQNVPEIAKELSMGQGEVKLILDLVDRAS